ncbi:DNA-directed RNA polymerase [Bertholletia excelsa]
MAANLQSQDAIQFTKKPYIEDVGPRKIKSIRFSMFSEAEIYKAAEVQVYRGVYYDSTKKPIQNGLLDPRMGPPNKNGVCATCHGSFTDCPGHYGYLTLALPVYNVGYLSTIVDILKCICKSCSRILLLEKERVEYLKKMRNPRIEPLKRSEILKKIVKKCNGMASSKPAECSRCGYNNGMVKKATGMLGVIHDRSKINIGLEEWRSSLCTKESKASVNVSPILNPDRVLSLFKKMPDEDCELLYLCNRPENLLVTNIAVPPLAIRPSVFVDGGTQSNESDVTERLKRIIQANASLQQELSETSSVSRSLVGWADLQMEVAQYINSDVRGVPLHMQAARPLSGFVQRLKGKQGRFRGNLSGKRVEYTGRTVISPDPNLKITEVAIPILMARILTYPERVSHHNIEKLRQCVRNGPDKYPGARFIRHPDGSLSTLMFSSRRKQLADDLKFGYIVDRHLEDGDLVLFNRQPSLHRMSIMCHRARIMPWRTLRFNESVCNPYNADFDGDEMNMHVPQTEEARTEALMLMGVQNNLCTPKNGEILVASTQDFLTSSFLITRKDTFYDRATFSLICSYMGDGMDLVDLPTPALIKPIELWTGKQLFNVLLRPHANMRVYLNLTVREKSYSKSGETMCPNDGFVYFRNSELISGQLGKATLGIFITLPHEPIHQHAMRRHIIHGTLASTLLGATSVTMPNEGSTSSLAQGVGC